MAQVVCKSCGRQMEETESVCPYCGTPREPRRLARVWVLAFFVMGVLMGLLLLVLMQGNDHSPPPKTTQSRPEPATAPVVAKIREMVTPRAEPTSENSSAAVEPAKIKPIRCDRMEARKVYVKARELATIIDQGERLQLRMNDAWEYYSEGHRRGFVDAFADADRCLQGKLRPIRFSYRGVEVASVSADGAVVVK